MPVLIGRVLLMLVTIAVAGCSGLRHGQVTSPPPATPTRVLLSNGIPVIVQERPGDVVAVQLWVRAGARDESAAELGLAHYLEHMLFKGTASRAPGFVEQDVERVGGRINAGTSWDYTFYHAVLPAARAAAGVEMLADIAVNASLDASLLEQEKHVVLEEMRRADDSPRGFMFRRLYSLALDGHPYGRPVIGAAPLIEGLTRETLVGFYRRHYVTEAFALVVVGAVSRDDVVRVAEATFGRLPRSGRRRLPTPPVPEAASRRADVERPGAYAHLGMAWLAPRVDHADTPALDLLATILGGSRSSRLVAALRERDGIVQTINAGFSAMEAAGLVTVTARLDRGDLVRAEAAIVREIERIRDDGVTEAERRRAVTAAEAEHEFSIESAEGRARAFGRAETIWQLEEELAYLGRVRAVTGPQIQGVARRYLDPARYARLALVPRPGGAR
jgi:zinc protease